MFPVIVTKSDKLTAQIETSNPNFHERRYRQVIKVQVQIDPHATYITPRALR